MNIIVCIKPIIDPNALASGFSISTDNSVTPPKDTPLIIDPASETALEKALKIKDVCGCKVTALSAGSSLDEAVLKKAIAMGADELLLIDDSTLENADAFTITKILSEAIKNTGECGLILCGQSSADWGFGVVASSLAEMLQLTFAGSAKSISLQDNVCTVKHEIDDDFREIEIKLPAVIGVSYEVGEARKPGVKGTMAAKRAVPTKISLQSLGLKDEDLKNSCSLSEIKKPEAKTGECEFITAETPEEIAETLLNKLKAQKLI